MLGGVFKINLHYPYVLCGLTSMCAFSGEKETSRLYTVDDGQLLLPCLSVLAEALHKLLGW